MSMCRMGNNDMERDPYHGQERNALFDVAHGATWHHYRAW